MAGKLYKQSNVACVLSASRLTDCL
jgi:hypothetical protein